MKIRSKALFNYLLESGVLEGTQEEIQAAKKEYRRKYQKQHKRSRRVLTAAIAISFTKRELLDIKVRAIEYGMNYTDYMKDVILGTLSEQIVIPNRHTLETILQNIGIALSVTGQGTTASAFLTQAENLLNDYLK